MLQVFTILLLAVISHLGVDACEGREGGYLPCDNARDGMDETFSLIDETLPSFTKLRTPSTRRYAHLSGEKKCRGEHAIVGSYFLPLVVLHLRVHSLVLDCAVHVYHIRQMDICR